MKKTMLFALACATFAVAAMSYRTSRPDNREKEQAKAYIDTVIMEGQQQLTQDDSFGHVGFEAAVSDFYGMKEWLDSRFSSIAQFALYEAGSIRMKLDYARKDDSGKASDQFKAWKIGLYLSTYDFEREQKRVDDTVKYFTETDWRGRTDYDAQQYAKIHRRLIVSTTTGEGVTLQDFIKYQKLISKTLSDNATTGSNQIFNSYIELYYADKLVNVPDGHFN